MKVVSVNHSYESREDAEIQLIPLGDIHRGSRGMDEKYFYKMIDYVLEHECLVLGMGDYGEFISKDDRRHDYAGISFKYLTSRQQYDKVLSDLEPIKKHIIGILAGNHEYTYWMRNEIDWANWLAAELDVPYCPDFAYVKIHFRRKSGKSIDRRTLHVLAHHGWTNARTDGYKIKVIQDMKKIFPQCHLYLMGHVHKLGEALPTTYLYVDNRDRMREFTQRYLFTGSYVKNYESAERKDENPLPFSNYAARKGYAPTMLGSPIIHIKPNRAEKGKRPYQTPFSIRYETLDWVQT